MTVFAETIQIDSKIVATFVRVIEDPPKGQTVGLYSVTDGKTTRTVRVPIRERTLKLDPSASGFVAKLLKHGWENP